MDITVTASVEAAGIALTDDKTFTDDTSASMYLAILAGTDETAIGENGATVTAQIAAAPTGAYKYSYDTADGYQYILDSAFTGDFANYSFQLTGAANTKGDWSAFTAAEPSVELTWTVAAHSDADVTVTGSAASVTWDRTSDLTIAVDSSVVADMSSGDFGINYNGTIYCYTGVYNGNTLLDTNSLATLAGNIITLNSSVAKFLPEGSVLYIIDDAKSIVARVTVN